MGEEVTDGGWGQEHVLMHSKDTGNAPNPGTEKPYISCVEVEDVCIKLIQPHMLVWDQKSPFMAPTKKPGQNQCI